jgi:hypothetical protein
MTSTLQLSRRARRIVPAVVIVVGLLLISAIMFQQVAAQDSGGLKPPFKLHRPANLSAPLGGVPPLPLNAPIVMSETFDSTFTQRFNNNVNDTTKPWHLVNANGIIDSSYTWGRVAGVPLTDTLWNAALNSLGAPQIIAGEPYTKNMQAYAVYGPINMTDYTSAFISVTYRMDVMEATDVISDDLFGMVYSTNGTDFTWISATSGRDPSLSIKRTSYYPIPASVMRQQQVWIALVFTSQDRDDIDALGVYVGDVVLRAQPAFKLYLPLIRRDPTPTPTLTPTPSTVYRYDYKFGTGATNDPEFAQWGGYKVTGCGTNCSYQQNITGQGNPGGALSLYIDGTNATGGVTPFSAVPTAVTAANFEYSADLLLANGQVNARYGLIFDASSTTFSSNPPFLPDRNYYKLELHISNTDRTQVTSYQLHRCSNGTCAAITSETNLPSPISMGQWRNVKIRQQGSNITFYLNNNPLVTASYDLNWGNDRRKFGMYLEAKGTNNVGGPLGITVDNVRVLDLP